MITTMKKIVLALALVGGTLAADAQVYLGGKLGLWSTKDQKTEVTLAPEIGYKLNKDFSLATALNYTLLDPKGDKNNVSVFEFNPYLRYTAARVGAVSFILDGALGFNWTSHEGASDSKFGWSAGVRPGISVDLNRNWFFVASFGELGYHKYNDVEQYGYRFSTTDVNLGFYYNF